MGKIRIKQLGEPGAEEAEKKKVKVQREEKKKRLVKAAGLKGGERVVAVGPTEEELEKIKLPEEAPEKPAISPLKSKKPPKRVRSQKYKEAAKIVEKGKLYKIKEAIPLLRKISLAKFDSTVEVHINTMEKGLRGTVVFPHQTGKEVKVMVATDELLPKIEKGQIDFDILVASPLMMPKLAKLAKILGPKGLMPNPKAGTISENPEALAQSLSKGQVQFKTEAEALIIHQVIGKLSFKDKELEENLKALVLAVNPTKIKNITLKSTISPGIKLDLTSI